MKPFKLTEAQIVRQVRDFLEYRGWRALRMQSALVGRPQGGAFRVGEKGMADYLFLLYRNWDVGGQDPLSWCSALVVWIEFKRPGKTPTPDQTQWMVEETARGAHVLTVSNFGDFADWYQNMIARRLDELRMR